MEYREVGMNPVAKLLITVGAILIGLGLFWQLLGRHLPLGRLPGDFSIEKENFKVYFPLATSLIVSAVLSLIMLAFNWFQKRS